ncbi:hypothetical protein TorRG33x02_189200 [Trema orientale]|uniref:Disease resistance N-terminal domain-containing protein n=1 Tax=Trema orientale TaxID=63057 RepID=A0A2P5EI75_TREOI|nr:hypothetical protein TorRG33x02_189200 [Trema orientale]
MAEAILFPIAELIIETLGSAAVQEIKSFWNVEDELRELEGTLSTIKAVLIDAEKRQIHEEQVRVWLQRLEDVVYLADDLVDDIVTEGLQRQVMMPEKKKKNVVKKAFSRSYSSWKTLKMFRVLRWL